MDVVLRSAVRALRAGEPLAVLQRTALREDAAALALRGVALARLGDLVRSASLLQRAIDACGRGAHALRAACLAAAGEVALAARDLRRAGALLVAAERTVRGHAAADLAHVVLLQARRSLLLGRVDAAATALATIAHLRPPLATQALACAVAGEIALRRRRPDEANAAFAAARALAERSGLDALATEIATASAAIAMPAARLATVAGCPARTLAELAGLGADGALVVDGCRRLVRAGRQASSLQRRPVLWALLSALATAAPNDVPRERLVALAFDAHRADESHRARLRVEMARLRALLRPYAAIEATAAGFRLRARGGVVHVLVPPIDSPDSATLALLADGQPWSTAAVALALGVSQRTVQRSLAAMLAAGQVERRGAGRLQRWTIAPLLPFATCMLLPSVDAFA